MPADVFESRFRPFREIGDIRVAHVDLTPHEGREKSALAWLDEVEHDRLRRFRYDRPRREFALCRAALRSVLCDHLECENEQLAFGISDHGKPFALVDGMPASVSVNVSHSGKHGLIAHAPRGRLGIDVEECVARNDLEGISEFVFGPGEQAKIALAEGQEKRRLFFTLWTLKEALIKALGTGFSLDPSQFEIPSAMQGGARKCAFRFPQIPDVGWKLENLSTAEFAAAIAYEMDPTFNRNKS